jgi:hypothetical protein
MTEVTMTHPTVSRRTFFFVDLPVTTVTVTAHVPFLTARRVLPDMRHLVRDDAATDTDTREDFATVRFARLARAFFEMV